MDVLARGDVMKSFRRRFALSALGLVCGCGSAGQTEVAIPLFLAGTDVSEPWTATGDVPVTLEQADLAFGPLYFCAGKTAGDLCETARLEWLDSEVVSATDPTPVRVGELVGLTGTVRSWMYDLGISSQLTNEKPFVLDAAQRLGGVSLVVSGVAQVEGTNLPFRAQVPISQSASTELGIPVIRSGSAGIFHEVNADEQGLLVRFDPRPWLKTIDFRPYLKSESCAPGGPSAVCQGSLAIACAGDGQDGESHDCAAAGQVCVAAQGCVAELVLEPDSEAFRSVVNAISSGKRPSFEWDYQP
jgi:hypothetical protein